MKRLTKPSRDLPSQDAFPQEIECAYSKFTEELTEMQVEYLDDLLENISKVAYTDGLKDALYLQELQ